MVKSGMNPKTHQYLMGHADIDAGCDGLLASLTK